jgi:hypothetical protein
LSLQETVEEEKYLSNYHFMQEKFKKENFPILVSEREG